MTLASSGEMSIGGSTANRSINIELGLSATATSSLNDTLLRNLAQLPASSQISLSNFYNKTYYYRASGTAAPVYGSGGASPWPPSGWTSIQNASVDDAFLSVSIPSVAINSAYRSPAYVGSNTYITFDSGSTAYSNLSASLPANNKIMLGAADNSYQRVAYINVYNPFPTPWLYTRIRYEGNGATSGTVGSPGIVYEITFFSVVATNNVSLIEVRVGNHNRVNGQFGIANTTTYYASGTIAANQSYVFQSNNTDGTSWTLYTGSYVAGW